MRTYSLAALILATVGTGLLSAFFLFSGLAMMPDYFGIDNSVLQSQMKSANQSIENTFWFWAVVTLACMAIALTTGAMLAKMRVRHQLPGRFTLAMALLITIQFLPEMAGFHSLDIAFAQVHAPIQSGASGAGWAAPERMRILLAGTALVSLIYSVALCVQVVHDNRGTRWS